MVARSAPPNVHSISIPKKRVEGSEPFGAENASRPWGPRGLPGGCAGAARARSSLVEIPEFQGLVGEVLGGFQGSTEV